MTSLSVNLNKFALLRNSRGANLPDVSKMAARCLASGAQGVTVHPRPDQRHARYTDVAELAQLVAQYPNSELNVEGAPIERFLEVVIAARPAQCTLVPDAPDQLTSDHGWNVREHAADLTRIVRRLRDANIRVSLFVDPSPDQIEAAAHVGAQRVELYTAQYAEAFGTPRQTEVLDSFRSAALTAHAVGLELNAGHDLNLQNLRAFLDHVPRVLEVSIGHALVCESFDFTLEGTLGRYLEITRAVR